MMKLLEIFVPLFIFLAIICVVTSRSLPSRAYCVFGKDEVELHKYAAILAASEPQRALRDDEIKKMLNPISFWLCKRTRSTDFSDPESKIRRENANIDAICESYEKVMLDLVNSYGLDPDTFNEISAKISGTPSLKKKILLQAYHYKLSAALESNTAANEKIHEKKIIPKSLPTSNKSTKDKTVDIVEKFCVALSEVEAERLEVRRGLLVNCFIIN